jgi:hypothetical protein
MAWGLRKLRVTVLHFCLKVKTDGTGMHRTHLRDLLHNVAPLLLKRTGG